MKINDRHKENPQPPLTAGVVYRNSVSNELYVGARRAGHNTESGKAEYMVRLHDGVTFAMSSISPSNYTPVPHAELTA